MSSVRFPPVSPSGLLSTAVSLQLGLGIPGCAVEALPPNTKMLGAPKKVKLSKRELQSQRSKAKKKNQDGWDEIIKNVRQMAKEFLVPSPAVNEIINLMESWTAITGTSLKNAVEKPFPPAQLIVAQPVDSGALRLLMAALLSRAAVEYSTAFQSKKYKGIRALHFWGCALSDESCRWISEACENLPFCTRLELLDCNLTGAAGKFLAPALKHRQQAFLRIIRLDNNPNFGSEGVRALAAALQFNSNLKVLSLVNCGIAADGGAALAKILQTPQSGIETLQLEGNSLGNSGLSDLLHGLNGNFLLSSLNLKLNEISSPVVLEQFLSILPNTKLRKINLDGNLIGDAGMEILLKSVGARSLEGCEEFLVSPFCNKGHFQEFSAFVEENAKKFKKPKKKRVKSAPKQVIGGIGSMSSLGVRIGTAASVGNSPAAGSRPGTRTGGYTNAISSVATSSQRQ